jgi:hypothetical protein
MRRTLLLAALICAALLGTALAEVRTWRDTTGKFSVDAELVEETDTEVKLRKADGSFKTVPKKLLSKADLAHLDELKSANAKAARKNQKWRKDYNALVETIKVKELGDGKYEIDWGEAKDLGDWYKIAVQYPELALQDRSKERTKRLQALLKEIEKADEALEGVEWTAKTKYIIPEGRSPSELVVPPLPKPLKIVFWIGKGDAENWTGLRQVEQGGMATFTVRFSVQEGGENPAIYAYIKRK